MGRGVAKIITAGNVSADDCYMTFHAPPVGLQPTGVYSRVVPPRPNACQGRSAAHWSILADKRITAN